ncbi:MAG TPA: 3-deoxy-7-phosphoheptulonate synthase [Polyangiaceae bacterium]|nr:3-deoxy-7-phosphoheptulonate synthase [Polyangiaceae bacterium]
MIVTLKQQADIDRARSGLAGLGLWVESIEQNSSGDVHLMIARGSAQVAPSAVEALPGVQAVTSPKSTRPRIDAHGPELMVGPLRISKQSPMLMAGPCAVESESQIHRIAEKLGHRGIRFLRGGAFKPRTSPYDFQGVGADALRWLRMAADANLMSVVTEVMSEVDVPLVAEYADIMQVGSRNMQNFALLKAVGNTRRPALLKRSMSASIEDWLHAGEYLLAHGAHGVLFCERGIRGFDQSTRNLLDVGAVALLAHVHKLPVIVDPSHACGRRDLVVPLAQASLAAGAAGLLLEVHDEPEQARSDGAQALPPEALDALGALDAFEPKQRETT